MWDLIILAVCFVAGYFYGQYKSVQHIVEQTKENPDALMEILREIKKNNHAYETTGDEAACEVKIEQHSSQYYLFRKDTDEFIAQGETFDLALAAAKARFPNLTLFYEKETV